MKFRYVPFWFYCLVIVAPILVFGFVGSAFESFFYRNAPAFSLMRHDVRMLSAISAIFVVFIIILIFAQFRTRIGYAFPFYSLTLHKDGVKFDLPLNISGFIAWRNISRISRTAELRGSWAIAIEFQHKLPVGPAGAERELSRLILRGNQILPSGEEFMEAAERYHRQATSGH